MVVEICDRVTKLFDGILTKLLFRPESVSFRSKRGCFEGCHVVLVFYLLDNNEYMYESPLKSYVKKMKKEVKKNSYQRNPTKKRKYGKVRTT